jgi:hypothetical protein
MSKPLVQQAYVYIGFRLYTAINVPVCCRT